MLIVCSCFAGVVWIPFFSSSVTTLATCTCVCSVLYHLYFYVHVYLHGGTICVHTPVEEKERVCQLNMKIDQESKRRLDLLESSVQSGALTLLVYMYMYMLHVYMYVLDTVCLFIQCTCICND